jgi:transcriptional regulator of met regulon
VLQTTSQLLSKHQDIEEKMADLSNSLAEKHPAHAQVFEKLAKDSLRHRDMALRAYREGVTDAFEVGFLANPLNPDEYVLKEPEGSISEDAGTMISNMEIVIRFCVDAANNSSTLLPDVPETFMRLVKRKKRSIENLERLV